MALNGNWVKWAVGLSFTIMLTIFPIMTNAIWSNDKDSRERDAKIQEEQTKTNQDILIALAEIKTDLKYLKNHKEKDD